MQNKKNVIFDSIDEAIFHLNEYKKNKNLGIWGDFLNKIDPFQDNMGSHRLGLYLKNLIEGFNRGLDRKDILINAYNDYSSNWGSDKIVSLND